MSSSENIAFYNYPAPREGPSAPYKNEVQSIPIFRGIPLVIGAALIQNIGFIQSKIWRDAGLNVIHGVPELTQYAVRFDPTVIPAKSEQDADGDGALDLSTPAQRLGKQNYYTTADYHALYKTGEVTPVDVVETLLPLVRREAQPPGKHSVAFLESQVKLIRTAAEASAERYKKGQPLGPLDGVPVAVKDEVHMEGYQRRLGSKMDFKYGLEGTSWCVKKWEEAGAIVIGKTTMHELGLDTNNNNPNYGTPRNPHDKEYYCGGSSGGSGYVVAAGLVPIALGADGGGSIRIPSSFCGLWGLKPSHGRVSASPTVGLAPTVGVYGPMATSIDDLALSYRIMAQPPPPTEDPVAATFPSPVEPKGGQPKKFQTIGIIHEWLDRADPAVRTVFDKALAHYRQNPNYKVVDIAIPYLPEGQRAHALSILAEIASGLKPSQLRSLSAPNRVLTSMGMYQITAQDYLAAQRLRSLLMSHLAHLFQKYPGLVIFSPATPIPGWHIAGGEADLAHGLSDGKSSVRNMEYVWLANFTGCPAISCPAGYVGDVPIGVMGMGEWGTEEELIEFARDGESLLDGGGDVKGLAVPRGSRSSWEDVIEMARSA